MSASSTSGAAPLADRWQEPWPGLASYAEDDSELFFGREREAEELLRLVRRGVLTVVFGPSGTGKTSLLNAGLFPRLRGESCLPVALRLDHSGEIGLVQQTKALLAEALQQHRIEEEEMAAADSPEETLWEYLHRVRFWDRRNRLVTPVLVFDQFEELFTLGRHRPESEAFRRELADLVENYIPEQVRQRLEAGSEELNFAYEQQHYKVVLSLREDYVWGLDGLRRAMPSVMGDRIAIRRMTTRQALDAVREPGREVVDAPVAKEIVSFVAGAQEERAEGDEPADRGEREIEPALLSLVCRELNARRQRKGQTAITSGLLKDARTDILNDFYERSFKGLDPKVRTFVEDRLLTPLGFRTAVPREDATGLEEAVDALIDRRLLRAEERLRIPHLELTHDVLTKVVQQSRDSRRERQRARRQRRLWMTAAGVALLITVVIGSVAAWVLKNRTEDAIRDDLVMRYRTEAGRYRAEARRYRNTVELGSRVRANDTDGLAYIQIQPGEFEMGCVPADTECADDERPRHKVAITKGFWLSQTEVTVAAYGRFVEASGADMPQAPDFNANWEQVDHPVVNVSWTDASAYCQWAGGRLPTEAEWEYAARGGKDGLVYPWGNTISPANANYGDSELRGTSPVGSYTPNAFGLYDMSGNVWEWVADRWGPDYYGTSPERDPPGPADGDRRVVRGGSWFYNPRFVRASYRVNFVPGNSIYFLGFRCAWE